MIEWFGKDGQYLRNMYAEGSRMGNFNYFRQYVPQSSAGLIIHTSFKSPRERLNTAP